MRYSEQSLLRVSSWWLTSSRRSVAWSPKVWAAARMALTSPPMSPGSTVTRDPSPWTSCERKARPVCDSLSSTESVMAWPDSEVPAARKVMGTERALAMGRMRATSASEVI